ncbi:Retrovirus-related Pol polyprotein from transposon RE2 [Vitis vinifera]|uniref:Retrovirus-related Pol polyprotein from transposon RE2 n=1 Tax=Vitis vinifera TaxID=29760 RepID=A0A438ERI4_VITVI|nr:Retrovirus-related Pol polyprotein from transposon RE2 [Vitis vinifera]
MASGASFSSTNNPITIQNSQDPQHPLITINLSNITKLSSTNSLTSSLQIQSLLEGYDLHHFIDGTHTPPPPIVTAIKTCADELALLGKPVDDEDLIDRVLEVLSDEYKSFIDAINVCDTSISFAELHEKLLNKEASLQTT